MLRRSVLILLSFVLTSPSYAMFGIGDVYKALKKLYGLEASYLPNLEHLSDIQTSTEEAAELLESIDKNTKGNFGFGRLNNTSDDVNQKLWSNDKWTDVLAKAQSSVNPVFTQAQERYEKLYPSQEPRNIRTTLKESDLTRVHYEQTRNISRAALAASSTSYDTINNHIRSLHDMLTKLEEHPEEKAAIDLNARLVAEVGFIQLEMLKQQSIQTQLIATNSQSDVNGLSDESKFLSGFPPP